MAADSSLGLTLGAIELSVLISSVFYGLICMQTFIYAQNATNDRPLFKFMVVSTFVLETTHIVLTWAFFYHISVSYFGDMDAVKDLPWTFDIALMVHALIVGLIQAFFTYRRTVVAFVIGVLFGREGYDGFKARHAYLVLVTVIISIVGDLWVTAALCVCLRAQKAAVYSSTIALINGIIAWTMETGLFITLTSIVILIAWVELPNTTLWMSCLLIYTRLYSSSLLVTLNTRHTHHTSTAPRNFSDPSRSIQHRPTAVAITRSVSVDVSSFESHERDSAELGSSKNSALELADLEGGQHHP